MKHVDGEEPPARVAEDLSAAAEDAQDYLDERVREQTAAHLLETLVAIRLSIKPKQSKRRIDQEKQSVDRMAVQSHLLHGLNLDEYKRRCRMRKLYCEPIEEVREDLEVFDRLGTQGYLDYKAEQRKSRSC